ncbi:MAG: indole-3-glycerol phosphate synthase TrpC, partial [Actinomycetota bacterium]
LSATGPSVIAEIKRRSPSRGDLNPGLDPAALAGSYASGGARCLSVLTDGPHFGGSREDLAAARAACNLPVLRKDFTVDPRDLADARLMGADAALLIVAALDDGELVQMTALAADIGLTALVEVHDRAEAERAVDAGAAVIGVNQRDLTTFEVRHDLAASLAPDLPDDVVTVAESGIRGPEDARRAFDAGFDAVLVGESLVTAPDPGAALGELVGR